MLFFALLGLVTLGLLAAEAFSSRRMNRSLWRDGFQVTVTHERLGIGRTPSEIEGRPAHPWRAEVWLHAEEGQLPRSLAFVETLLKMPPPDRIHLLDGSLYSHAGPTDYPELDRVVRDMVAYAKALAKATRSLRGQAFEAAMKPTELGRAHLTRAGDDRLSALDLLLTYFPASLEADVAAKDAVVDANPAVRLRAARALAEAGVPVVMAIVSDDAVGERLRVEALKHLSLVLPRAEVGPVIVRSLDPELGQLRAEAGRLAGQLKIREAVPRLLDLLSAPSPADKRALLVALGRIGDARAEPAALAHLDDEDADVCREAIRCLGRVGRPEAVVPRLKAWLRGSARPPSLRELAEAVISALARPGDERGSLSLVSDDGLGAVSVTDAQGAVAIIGDP